MEIDVGNDLPNNITSSRGNKFINWVKKYKMHLVSALSVLIAVGSILFTVITVRNVSQDNPDVTSIERVKQENTDIEQSGVIPKIVINEEVESFNDTNWQKYHNAWLQTRNLTGSILECKTKLDSVHTSLGEAHKDYLRSKINDEDSNTLRFKEGIYRYSENTARLLERVINTYDMQDTEPDFIPEIYVLEDVEDSNEGNAIARINQILSELEKIRKFSNDIKCLEVTEIEKVNREKICDQIVSLNYSAREIKDPIYREQFEIDEEYELALKERKDDKEYALYECENYSHSYH